MSLPDAKALKKLAAACRAAGITSFKGDGIEFTLSTEAPVKINSKGKIVAAPKDLGPNEVESDELSAEALMYWSVGGDENSQENA